MTITDKLEGLLPEAGPVTKTDHIIAEAVEELRTAYDGIDEMDDEIDVLKARADLWRSVAVTFVPIALAIGIAVSIASEVLW